MTGSPLQRAYTWLEPDEGKLSCPVVRGGSVSNDALLPDFTGLSALVQTALEQAPLSGHVFAFRGRRGDLIKLLWFDGDGLCLFSKEARAGTICVDAGRQWKGISDPCAAVDAA